MLEGGEGLGRPSNPASEIVEVKPVSNLKGCILRFACFYAGNNDQVAIVIDEDAVAHNLVSICFALRCFFVLKQFDSYLVFLFHLSSWFQVAC
ncbi:hypothetical protein NC653_017940 [Populus alba x Populus x berolinensis]|uniref:Uncharacterized protein n=1 Tax=Populus alba x Populus x berolinensis TaxID=444605 RepID=A0AAD6W1U0_9ROSI|nr:hypothetical protein NC653_017940 [Populus alba x Populus x berolinensis]